jgi:invasion protein IalB
MTQLANHLWRKYMMITVMTALLANAGFYTTGYAPAFAQSTSETSSKPESTHKDWEAHTHGKGGQKQCFMTSTPKQLQGEYDRSNRGPTRIYVTHRNGSRNEISTYAGYRYRDQSEVIFKIDGKTYKLYIDGNYAWAYENDASKMIAAMRRGKNLTVTGISSRGNKTIDIYSLSGFTAAYKAINALCPK